MLHLMMSGYGFFAPCKNKSKKRKIVKMKKFYPIPNLKVSKEFYFKLYMVKPEVHTKPVSDILTGDDSYRFVYSMHPQLSFFCGIVLI